jgi:hypothetical protein
MKIQHFYDPDTFTLSYVVYDEKTKDGVLIDPGNSYFVPEDRDDLMLSTGNAAGLIITVDGKKRIALIKDIERNQVKARIQHVSFHAVKASSSPATFWSKW